jgi:hypothetical protein
MVAKTETSEIITYSPEWQFVEMFKAQWHGHAYQPIRSLWFNGDQHSIYDISGRNDKNPRLTQSDGWNGQINLECYEPLLDRGIIQNPLVSIDVYPSLMDWLRVWKPEVHTRFMDAQKNKPHVATPPTQLIYPAIDERMADVWTKIGLMMHKQDYRQDSIAYWLPEAAVNNKTFKILYENGIRFVFLQTHQLEVREDAPLYSVETGIGQMYVIPIEEKLSESLAFDTPIFADIFADRLEKESQNRKVTPLTANDLETWGHQKGPDSLNFIDYLINQELQHRLAGQKGQGNLKIDRNLDMVKPAKLKAESSWSCSHGIGRWTGAPNCYCDGVDQNTIMIKHTLYEGLKNEMKSSLDELDTLAYDSKVSWKKIFINFYVNQRYNLAGEGKVRLDGIMPMYRQKFKKLLTLSLGMQSCAFFFNGNYERNMGFQCLEAAKHVKTQDEHIIYSHATGN